MIKSAEELAQPPDNGDAPTPTLTKKEKILHIYTIALKGEMCYITVFLEPQIVKDSSIVVQMTDWPKGKMSFFGTLKA